MFESLSSGFQSFVKYVSGKSVITDKNIEDAVELIKTSLVEADVNIRVIRRFVNSVIEDAKGIKVLKGVDPKSHFIKIVNDKLISFLGDKNSDLALNPINKKSFILLLGLQGSGKTTSAAKLAKKLKDDGRKVLLVAADTFRSAAVEQLKVLGSEINVSVFSVEDEKKSINVVKKAIKVADKESFDTIIIDTQGRLEVDQTLLKEAKEIKNFVNPIETILVADTMLGQTAVNIAKEFNDNIGISGVIFTKFDSDSRGGAALSLKTICNVPIKFVGVGEKVSDLEVFYPERMASRILGMGDVVSLVEKAQSVIDETEARKLEDKIQKSTFDFEDYLAQFSYMKKMGGISSLAGMLPGVSKEMLDSKINESDLRKEEAIILSMTKRERKNPLLVNNVSRKKRIAIGSGTSIFDVNKLIKKFGQTTLMMKKMKNKKFQNKVSSLFGN